jgi:flagellar basal-body rod modification protein FlgD
MSVLGIGGAIPSVTDSAGSTAGGNSNSAQSIENSFLQLLVAQLQYQNPLQPMSNTQFVTQLAQMQTLSVLESMRSDLGQLVKDQGHAPASQGSSSPTT